MRKFANENIGTEIMSIVLLPILSPIKFPIMADPTNLAIPPESANPKVENKNPRPRKALLGKKILNIAGLETIVRT